MLHNPFRKLIQISEETLPLTHVPLILGNEFFIVTQQDVRKIEDTRMFSISKVMPNGDLKALNDQDASFWLQQILKQENSLSNSNFDNILEFLIGSRRNHNQESQQRPVPQAQQENPSNYGNTWPQPMETTATAYENRKIASIEQQLQWNQVENNSALFPMNYSTGTSTTDFEYKREIRNSASLPKCSCKMCKECGICRTQSNKGTNTTKLNKYPNKKSNEILNASEQLKKKKLSYSFI